MRSAVKQVLARHGVKEEHFEVFLVRITEHAKAMFAAWSLAA
jgi:hypothetical protein